MTGYVALGSNLGDRAGNLLAGIDGLSRRGIEPLQLSSVWETEPVECTEPLWFLNMVARIRTGRGPVEVLDILLECEREAGRVRAVRNEPRILDLDLLLLGDLRVRTDRLVLPHPRMWERPFVLAPLAELDPGLRNPASGRTVAEELERASGGKVRRTGTLSCIPASPYNP